MLPYILICQKIKHSDSVGSLGAYLLLGRGLNSFFFYVHMVLPQHEI